MKEALDLRGINFEDGYIAVVDKPLRWTSTDVVRKIKFALRRLGYRKIKVGHAGTLDPLATGVLLVCIGRATKMVDALQAEEKEYVADVMLGATTPSYDLEHPVDATFPTQHITRGKVLEALAALSGERLQRLNSHNVADALRYFSGIQIKDYGGVGGLKTVNIRSMGTNHVGVFYDGIELGNAQNGTVDLGRFSLDNMESVTLYNGQK
jgi:tRNA pseudouridine(55) synthase